MNETDFATEIFYKHNCMLRTTSISAAYFRFYSIAEACIKWICFACSCRILRGEGAAQNHRQPSDTSLGSFGVVNANIQRGPNQFLIKFLKFLVSWIGRSELGDRRAQSAAGNPSLYRDFMFCVPFAKYQRLISHFWHETIL